MAVYFEPDTKRWRVDFIWSDVATGKTRRIRRTAKDAKGRLATSKTAAEQHETRIRTALATGTFEPESKTNAAPETPTLASFRERYFADHVSKLKPSMRSGQERLWRVWLLSQLGEMELSKIDAESLAKLTKAMQANGSSPKTINNCLSALRTALTHANDWGLLAAVPRIRWLKVPQQKFDFFTFEEAAQLAEHAPPMVVFAMKTGMRLGELLALRWSDISMSRRQATVQRSVFWEKGEAHTGAPKNHKLRTLPLSTDALAALETVKAARRDEGDGYVFVNAAGSQLTKGETKWPLWRAQEAADLRRTGWHVLRHTFASHLVMKGASLSGVQALLGHSTIQMTQRYAHLAPDHLRATIGLLDG